MATIRTRQMRVGQLRPHPLNSEIYGSDGMTPDFLASVQENGILVPLAIKADGTIISGHRRWQAAQECGLSKVPVHVVEFPSDIEERQALLDFNKQRDKTFSQRMAEAVELEAIEKERAKVRRKAGLKQGNKQPVGQKSVERGRTDELVASAVGIGSRDTFRKAKSIYKATKCSDPDVRAVAIREMKKLDAVTTTINDAWQTVGKAERRRERQKRRREAIKNLPPVEERYQVLCGDIGEVYKTLPQVDAIITDPPYAKRDVPVFKALADVAAELLVPGGSLLAMSGHAWVPEILAEMTAVEGIHFHWLVCYLTPGPKNSQLYQRKVSQRWKPVLWFVKGTYKGCQGLVPDLVASKYDDTTKEFHPHGQSVNGFLQLVRWFSEPGDLVLDPFVGGGTTGVACLQLGRRFIGVDINQDCVETTLGRLGELTETPNKTQRRGLSCE